MSEFLQSWFAAVDTLGICLFASLPILETPELPAYLISAVSAKLGVDLSDNFILELGRNVCLCEKKFNRLAGFGASDDRLPGYFREEPLTPLGNVWDVPDEDLDSVFAV